MTSSAERPRVLFVDRDLEAGRAFQRAVLPLGYDVDVVLTAGEALERAHGLAYPIVVTDSSLRGVDGYAVIDAIGAFHPQTAFVIVTGDQVQGVPSRFRAHAAVSSSLRKPWDIGDISAKLQLAYHLHERRSVGRSGPDPVQRSVLIVEDNPTDVLLLRRHLAACDGVRVTVVSSLAAANVALHDAAYEVIFTDLNLPDARGMDAVLRLRSSGPSSAIVVCTGVDDEPMMLQLLQMGAHECVSKSALSHANVYRALAHAIEREKFELRLAQLAYYDALTGAANRTGWTERAGNAIDRALRRQDRVAIVMVDLDGFKEVNDDMGHDAGDVLLQQVVTRMQRLLREYDIVARLGGDEFALLIADIGPEFEIAAVGQRLLDTLQIPFHLNDQEPRKIGASIGIAIYPEHGTSLVSLLKVADVAMYCAKREGKNRAVVGSRSSAPNVSP